MKLVSKSAAQTKKVAAGLARKIIDAKPPTLNAKVVALVGDLGAGKTTFVQGFAKALGIKRRMVSPTFLIFRKYQIPKSKFQINSKIQIPKTDFYHVDVYRIHKTNELNALNFKSILHSPLNIVLIEWAEKIKKILPKDAIWVHFTHGRKETERIIAYRL